MTPTALPVVFACAAAVLALWVNARLPDLRPARMLAYVAHLAAAILAIELAATLVERLASRGELVLGAVLFAGLLPAFVYAFLTSIWLLRMLMDGRRGVTS